METPTEATGFPSEGSGQSWGLFSSRRPHLPQQFPLCFANPPCVRNPRAVNERSVSFRSVTVSSTRLGERICPASSAGGLDSTSGLQRLPRLAASLGSPPPSVRHRLPRATAAGVEPPPPPLSRRRRCRAAASLRRPPFGAVPSVALRRPPFGTDRKQSKLGSWARTSARALGTHGSPPPVAEGHRNGSPPPSAAGPPRPRPFSHGPWSCRRPWNRRPPATRWSWEPPVAHILCRVCSGVSDALNV